jgi:phage tail-like protein
MENEIHYPPVGFYFTVSLGGEDVSAFQEVSGLSMKIMGEAHLDGGNSFEHKLPTIPKYENLVLKRGVLVFGSKFHKWCDGSIQQFSFVPKNISVSLLDTAGKPLISWTFFNAYPVAIKYSEPAKNMALGVETIELAYDYFARQQ